MSEKTIIFYAVRTSGHFLKGHSYRRDQLGVLGRMAVKAGYLIPVEQATPKRRIKTGPESAVRPRSVGRRGKTKGEPDGTPTVRSGGSAEVRDDSGTQGSESVHSSDQQESQA